MKLTIKLVINPGIYLLAIATLAAAAGEEAKLLPDGPGKEIVGKACLDCHDASAFRKKRVTKERWSEYVGQMVDQGANASEAEQTAIIDYLAQNFGPGSKVRINTAPFSEIRTVLDLTSEETKAIIDYREKNGNYKDFRDLMQVPGLNSQKMEAKKDLLAF